MLLVGRSPQLFQRSTFETCSAAIIVFIDHRTRNASTEDFGLLLRVAVTGRRRAPLQ